MAQIKCQLPARKQINQNFAHCTHKIVCVCVCYVPSVVSDSLRFYRHEYWSGLPSPPPGNLPKPGIEPTSPASPALAGSFFTTQVLINLIIYFYVLVKILQRNNTNRISIDIQKEIYFGGLSHAIMEAQMAHNPPSLSWRPRKTNNVVLVQTQRPELQEDGYNIT